MPFSLKRLASSLRLSSRNEPIPILLAGWNGLPEDIFNLIIKDYLHLNQAALASLSQTCRAYAMFCRPHLLRTVCVTGAPYDRTVKKPRSQIEQLKYELKQRPQLCGAIGTLRILNTDRRMQIQTPGPRPSLTKVGESLVFVLSQTFPHLTAFELPLLERECQWSDLSVKLQDAICSFLQRHDLQELSMTTHYPFQLVKHCPNISKLEYRVYELSSASLDSLNEGLLGVHRSQGSDPIGLRELVIQDPVNQATTVAKHLVQWKDYIDLKKVENIMYYGNDKPGAQLPALLNHCSESLTSLNIYVSHSHGDAPKLDLHGLRRLKHLTLSVDRRRQGPFALSWVVDVTKLLYSDKANAPPLETLEIVIRTSPRTIEENLREMSYGWHGLAASLREGSTRRGAGRGLKGLTVVVCTEEAGISGLDYQATLGGLKRHLIPLLQFDPSVTVDVRLIKDTFERWLRFPSFGQTPLH